MTDRARPPLRLQALGGEPAPAEVQDDFRRFVALPERALASLWEILGAGLGTPDPALERRAEAFCRLYEVPALDLQAALRVCRFLLTRATSMDLPAERLAEDAVALGGGDTAAARVLLAGYDQAKAAIRRSLIEETLLDHGKVLVGMDWRVDRISGSDRALDLESPVVVMTLRLREGAAEERVTFYLAPDAFHQFKDAWTKIDRVLDKARQAAAKGRDHADK